MVRRATTDLEVSVSPVHAIKTLRLLAEEAGWPMERHERSEERRVGKEGRSRWSPYH